MRRLLASLLLCFASVAWAEPEITLVRVIKGGHRLELWAGNTRVHAFHAVFGANPEGHKMEEGDERTPEGSYVLDYKNPNSGYHRSIHVSYPNARDLASAKARGVPPGGQIMIHGQKNGLGWLSFLTQRSNWTNGCVALSDADMDVVWSRVKVGTPIEIRP